MPLEIERKFLVKNCAFLEESYEKKHLVQGFLNSDKNRTVRIRIDGLKSFLTVKGLSNASGTTRFEWEKEIPLTEGKQLLSLCEQKPVEKYRYLVKKGSHLFEVDVFLGENEGLVVAEIELDAEDTPFEKPNWLGREVTGEVAYYNSCLSKNPFRNW